MTSKSLIVLLAAVSLVGCTSMRPLDANQANLASKLEAGDHVVVYERSGRILDMDFRDLQNDRIRGWATDGTGPVSVGIDDVEHLEIEKIDGVKTTLAVAGGTVAAAVVIAGAAVVGAAAVLGGGM
jgi:hypothetical protein